MEQRSQAMKEQSVDPAALKPLFTDYQTLDPFLADLYVGFVAGALGRHQHHLLVTEKGRRAVVGAGNVKVVMHLEEMRWVVDLERSIPDTIKARAMVERNRIARQLARRQPGK